MTFHNCICCALEIACQASWFPSTKCPRFALFIQCLICIPCYTSLNLRGLTPLFGLSLLLTTLEGLCHFCICSSVLFNRDLGLSSSSSKSVMSFLLSSMFCSVSFYSSSVSSCSSSSISTSSGSNLNFALSGSASFFLLYQTFSFVANYMVIGALISLSIKADGLCFLSARGTIR